MTISESRIKRAIYRANYRGTKELDILLGRFAKAELEQMTEGEFDAFEELLGLPDPQIDRWIKGEDAPPAVAGLIERIRQFHGLGN